MNINLIKNSIELKRKQIAMYELEIKTSQQVIAEHLCPFAVGDDVISPDGEKMQIASIKYRGYGRNYSFMAYKFRNNGMRYKNPSYVHDSQIERFKVTK